jgi:single-strand DNA-binding protein
MNSVTIKGNLGSDPELRSVGEKASSVASFSIAVSTYKGKDASGQSKYESFWVKIVSWGPLAERMAKNLAKGDGVVITGRLDIRSYTDKDGAKRTTTEVVAAEFTKAARNTPSTSGPQPSAEEDLFGADGFSSTEYPAIPF